MSIAAWVPFLVLCLTVELTPGPNMAYLAILSAGSGRRAGFSAVAGIALGLACVGMVAALGVAEIIRDRPLVAQGLTLCGVGYLLWLAWQTWREDSADPLEAPMTNGARGVYFRRGLITNLLNPKAFVFYAAVLPGFISGPLAVQEGLVLTLVSVAIATTVHLGIVCLAGTLKPYMRDPSRQRRTRRVMALLLVGVAIWFAASNLLGHA